MSSSKELYSKLIPDSSDSDEEEYLHSLRKTRNALQSKKLEELRKQSESRLKEWEKFEELHKINSQNERYKVGVYQNLRHSELQTYEDEFYRYLKISTVEFVELNEVVRKHFDYSISSSTSCERLGVTLRYLITGKYDKGLIMDLRMDLKHIPFIINNVVDVMCKVLEPLYMPVMKPAVWKQAENGFKEKWNFPNCVGNIDIKKVFIKPPVPRGTKKVNSKLETLYMMAIIDPEYKFTMVDLINADIDVGKIDFATYLYKNGVLLAKPLPGTTKPVPYVLVGDENFSLKPYLMVPFHNYKEKKKEIKNAFDNRVMQTRKVVDKTFTALISKWGILKKNLECDVDMAKKTIKASIYLYNFLKTKEGYKDSEASKKNKISTGICRCNVFPDKEATKNAEFVRRMFETYFENN